jgi:glycosyltransferase involved in cell wall biosynthesis
MALDARPLRILMILESGFPVRGGGGAESQVRTLSGELRRRGHRVTLLTPRVPNAPQKRIDRCEGIPVVRLGYPRMRGVARFVLWLRTIAFLRRRGHRYDAWHAHIAHWLAAIACTFAPSGKPVIVKVSGWWELEQGLLAAGASPLARLARRALQKASAVQAISQRIAAELIRQGFDRARIVALPNAVDTQRFAPAAHGPPGAEPTLRAIFVGRLVREKGLHTLLEAWAVGFGSSATTRLRLVGGGPLEANLRARAKTLGIGNAVEFLGHREDIQDLIHASDFGVLPSVIEGLSNTLLECMACGLPVIASRISGSEDFVVPGRNGWLFPAGDVAALAACLRDAAALSGERRGELGFEARQTVLANASLDSVVDRLVALYRGAAPSSIALPVSTLAFRS